LSTHISPNSFPYISFLGLGYPVLLGLIFIFSLFWILFRRKYVLFNVVVFLLGWNHFADFYAFNNSEKVPGINSVKVMSYNVRIFNYYNVKNRIKTRNNIFDLLKKEDAGIYCFQEYYHRENAVDFKTRDTMIQFLQASNYHERYTHEMTGKQYFGVATFSMFPIVNKGGIGFDNDDNNYCIYTDLKVEDDTLRVFNAHLGSIRLQNSDYALFGDSENMTPKKNDKEQQHVIGRLKLAFEKRAIQVEKVMSVVNKSPYPVLMCGDFNDTPVSYCYNLLTENLIDAFVESGSGIGTTYIGKIPSNRIDYICHSEDIESLDFKTHDVSYSDHKPISCYLKLNQD
jgi:endonuclease/exonuclease/phosphatase family metal-dependent hydrolase